MIDTNPVQLQKTELAKIENLSEDDEETSYDEEDGMSAKMFAFREKNPELYGVLSSAEKRIADAGDTNFWIVAILTVGACVGLYSKVLDVVVATNLDMIRAWPTYVLIGMIGIAIGSPLMSGSQESAYESVRDDLFVQMKTAGRSKYELIAFLDGEEGFDNVLTRLQKDEQVV